MASSNRLRVHGVLLLCLSRRKRLCVDYRRLNGVSRFDAYPMPCVDDLIIDLVRRTIYLARGYWQVPLAEGAQEKTAFATPFGLFQFTVMPFGLPGAPATFQRLMDRLIHGMEDHSGSYIDDLVIYSETWEEHLQHVRAVLTRLREANLTAKARKCDFGAAECTYLGHRVGGGVVRPEKSKLLAIQALEDEGCVYLPWNYGLLPPVYSQLFLPCHPSDRPDSVVSTQSSCMGRWMYSSIL